MKNGFALTITLLFLLLLTLLGFSLLLIAGNYHTSTRNLFEKENARIACDQGIRVMVDRHNLDTEQPRFFFNNRIWQRKQMTPFLWIHHEIGATLEKAWSATEPNLLTTTARRGPYAASRLVQLRQRRLEDFALYLDSGQELTSAPLFDGPVFARDALVLNQPGVMFRQIVQAPVQPPEYASCRRRNLQTFSYAEADSFLGTAFFQQQAKTRGLQITAHNPLFWKGSRYELNLDLIQFERLPRNKWRVRYNGTELGVAAELLLWFDDSLAVSQNSLPPPFLVQKPSAPLYIASAQDILLLTGIHTAEDSAYRYPIAVAASDALYLDASIPRAVCVEALLIALGSDRFGEMDRSLFIAEGGTPLSADQIAWFRSEVITSAFLVENQQRDSLFTALDNGERIVWFRGGLVLSRGWQEPAEAVQLHFQSGKNLYPLLPSFPFVYIVEGSEQWQ